MLEPGISATIAETVGEEQTAERVGSGEVEVYATPMVLALVERAAVAAVKTALDPGTTSVGARVELDHLAPTPPGARVEATAVLEEVDGRRLRFSFEVRDPGGVVARGAHLRVLVDRGPFLEGGRGRGGGPPPAPTLTAAPRSRPRSRAPTMCRSGRSRSSPGTSSRR